MLSSSLRAIFFAVLGLGVLPGAAGAEPLGTEFTYQGDLHFQGAPANGSFDFRFFLYADADGLVLVDGPLKFQDVPVSDGLFTVELDFAAGSFAGDARWLEVRVREGTSDSGFSQLLPLQKITAAPYSLHAEMVAANAIGSVEIADASITSADLAGGAVTSVKIATDAVGSNEADGTQIQLRVSGTCPSGSSIRTVTADGTVTCEVDDDTTFDGTDFALSNQGCASGQVVEFIDANGNVSCVTDSGLTIVTSTDIVDETIAAVDIGADAVGSSEIGADAVGSSEVDNSQVQLRVSGNCSVGQTIQSIAADGTVTCGYGQFFSSRPTFALIVDNPANLVGRDTSIAIAPDGLPVISYRDFDAFALKVAKCNDAACSGGDETITTVDDPANSVGEDTSIAIAPDGLPVISYYDATADALKVAKCSNADCSSAALTTVDNPTNSVGEDTSIAIAPDGLPVISYYDATADALKVAKCNDAACSSGNETISTVDATNDVGRYTSIAIAPDGLPVISYYDANAGALKVAKCNDAACSGGDETITTVDDPTNAVGLDTSIAIAPDGLPVISYYDIASAVKVAKCNDAACSGGDETITTVNDPNNVGRDTSIAIAPDGLPVISYYDFDAGALKVAKCGNLDCS